MNGFLIEYNKELIQQIVMIVSNKYKGKECYGYINSFINKIKIGLNMASSYSKEYYLIKDWFIKTGNKITSSDIHIYGNEICDYIDYDFKNFNDLILKDYQINDNEFDFSVNFSINTFLNDIEGIKDDHIFIQNVQKIMQHNLKLSNKWAYDYGINKRYVKLFIKQSKQILRRIK